MNLLATFLQRAILQGVPILYGASGEILTEKSGNLNLGIPGIMYMGGVSGLIAAFFYERAAGERASGLVGLFLSLAAALLISMLAGLLYSFLTVTLRANQNVVGLSLTTFGVGFGNFFGGSISQLAGGVGQISTKLTAAAYRQSLPGLSKLPFVGKAFFSFGFLTYFSIILALCLAFVLTGTRKGLEIRAVGEDPAAADAAGVDVNRVKYVSTVLGAALAGLGGLCFVMEYLGGTWANDGFGDRGWLAVALVILSVWNARKAVWGSFLFGGLYILYLYIPGLNRSAQELFKMLPYLATILVLIQTGRRNRAEDQPPASLGLSYFREER